MRQQRFFTLGTNAIDIIQGIFQIGLRAFGPMRADRKTMGFIAQTLHKIQHRIIVPQCHHRFAGAIEFFFARIAIYALCHADHGDIF